MLRSIFLFCFAYGLFAFNMMAQTLEVINEDPYTPATLIESVFLGEGIDIIDVTYTGDDRSAAFFRGGSASIGIDRGIVMTTGITVAEGSQFGVNGIGSQLASVNSNSPLSNDVDLRTVVDNPTTSLNDITSYEITFRPLGDTVSFRYVFASEEYPEYVCSRYNDIFGFFISGPGINGPYSNGGINLAQIPGTMLPVRINTVNPGTPGSNAIPGGCDPPEGSLVHSNQFVNNVGSPVQPIFDGRTRVFTATTAVQACEEYTIRLIIADVGDPLLDSGVFLEARSFGGDATNLEIVNLSIDGTMVEGCAGAELHFYTPRPVEDDLDLVVDFFGSATPGVDYTQPPGSFTIPAGDSLLIVPLSAFEDNFNDDGEMIQISLERSGCLTDTFDIRIESNRLGESQLIDEVTICGGETVNLDATITGSDPQIFSFSNTEQITWDFGFNSWRSAFINVNGVIPEILSPTILQSVCIDEIQHNRPAHLDIFLVNPNGVTIELTSDNGGTPPGSFPFRGYRNTCFTPTAVTPITLPGQQAPESAVPFTGDWIPEDALDDLWFGNQPTNGQWELRMRDDSPFNRTRYRGWSITFQRPYAINYEWDPAANLSCYDCPDPVLTAEDEGFVNVIATDIYGCSVEDSVAVNFLPTPDFSAPVCEIVTDTSITFSWGTAAGVVNFEVAGEDRNWFSVGLNTSLTVEGLTPDSTLTLFVRGVFADCIGPAQSVSCTTLPCQVFPDLVGTPTDITCFGDNNGTLSLTATGQHAPFRYFVNGNADNDGLITDLGPGTYEAIARDNRGCSDTLDLTINEPDTLLSNIIQTGSIGCNSVASLAAVPMGGTGPYTYQWNNTPGDSILANLSAGGTFNLQITDANGCMSTASWNITAPAALTGIASVVDEACSNRLNGSISIEPGGGTPGYSYQWSAPGIGNTPNATGLSAGTYFTTITDNAGCEIVLETVVGSGPDVLLSGTPTGASCFGSSNGRIVVTTEQGEAPFDFSWDNPLASGANPDGLRAGTYNLTLTDNRGCQLDTFFVITEPAVLLGTGEVADVNCNGDTTGQITFLTSGGTAPYTYNWSNGSTDADPGNLAAGNYQLLVTDANGCTYDDEFTVSEAVALSADFVVTDVDCPGTATGTVQVAAENGVGPYDIFWPSLGARGALLNDLEAGIYEVQITDANGCLQTQTVTVNEPPALIIDPVLEDVRCAGETSGLLEISVDGGTPGYEYRLDADGIWSRNNVFLGLAAGTYTAYARDENACVVSLPDLNIMEPDRLEVDLGERLNVVWGDSIQLGATIAGGTLPIVSYQWAPADSLRLSCADCPTPWFRPNEQTSLTLRITDQAGCVARDVVTILVEKDFPVLVPTGFTPNGDGMNDLLIVHGRPDIEILSFQVFDRWGELIFESKNFMTNDPDAGWDGYWKGQALNGGVFIWQADALMPDGTEESFRGQTNLLR